MNWDDGVYNVSHEYISFVTQQSDEITRFEIATHECRLLFFLMCVAFYVTSDFLTTWKYSLLK